MGMGTFFIYSFTKIHRSPRVPLCTEGYPRWDWRGEVRRWGRYWSVFYGGGGEWDFYGGVRGGSEVGELRRVYEGGVGGGECGDNIEKIHVLFI